MEYLNRTTLYGMNPMEIGNVFVESLTSYIIRLAEAHMVSTGNLLACEIASKLNKDYLTNSVNRGGNRFYDGAHFLNGFGTNSTDMIKCLSNLTGKNFLVETTLMRFSGLFGTRYLVRKKIAWCPKCLQMNRYYPLVWCLTAYTTCSIHKIPLQENCTNCTKKIPQLHRRSRIGICPYCQNTFFDSSKKYNKPSEKDIYISKDIEKLFLFKYKMKLDYINVLQLNLLNIVENKFQGNIDGLAKYVKIPKTTMWDWCRGKVSPPLNKVLYMAYKLGVSSVDLYTQVNINDLTLTDERDIVIRNINKREKSNLSEEYVISYFNDIAVNKDVIKSISTIARELNCSTKYLYKNFSEYCERISGNNNRIKENKETEKWEKIRLLIHDQFLKESSKGCIPTRKVIEEELGIPFLFVNRRTRNFYFHTYSTYALLNERMLVTYDD